jgi:hypothetical protein
LVIPEVPVSAAMGLDFESAREKVEALFDWAAEHVADVSRNEATTRSPTPPLFDFPICCK